MSFRLTSRKHKAQAGGGACCLTPGSAACPAAFSLHALLCSLNLTITSLNIRFLNLCFTNGHREYRAGSTPEHPAPNPQGLSRDTHTHRDTHRLARDQVMPPPPVHPAHPHLGLLLSQPLKHVGVELLLLLKLLADALLAHDQLGLGRLVAGVELQNLLEVSPCQIKVIHCQVGLSPAEEAFLIVAV